MKNVAWLKKSLPLGKKQMDAFWSDARAFMPKAKSKHIHANHTHTHTHTLLLPCPTFGLNCAVVILLIGVCVRLLKT